MTLKQTLHQVYQDTILGEDKYTEAEFMQVIAALMLDACDDSHYANEAFDILYKERHSRDNPWKHHHKHL